MAKTKKRPMPRDGKKMAGLTPASKLAHMAAVEDVILEAEEKEEERKAEENARPSKAKENQKEDAEKAEMYALLKRLMDDMGADSLSAFGEMIDRAETEKLIRVHGLDRDAAKLFLSQQEKVRALREAKAAAAREAIYAEMRTNPLYADVDSRRSALEAFIFRTGVSPKEAYNALFGEERLEKMRKEMEEKMSAAEKHAKRIPALSGPDAPDTKGHIQLSEAEKWAAAGAGMTPEEYARYKYSY